MPLTTSDEHFDDLVADALDSVPEALLGQLDNVVVLVEDEPSRDQLQHAAGHEGGVCGASCDPSGDLLGLYEGVPLTERGSFYAGYLPDRITLFRGPLRRACRSEAELLEQVRITVVHEIAHHFGIDDDRLDELGWG